MVAVWIGMLMGPRFVALSAVTRRRLRANKVWFPIAAIAADRPATPITDVSTLE